MRKIAVLAALLLVAVPARAGDAPMTPEQMQTYVGILFGDRTSQQLQIDRLRLQIEDLKSEAEEIRREAAAHDAAVDRYWKAFTGLSKR